jgi:tetratricopeptide (TPR) repeat protein
MKISTLWILFLAGIGTSFLGMLYFMDSHRPFYSMLGWGPHHFGPMTSPSVFLLGVLIAFILGFGLYRFLFPSAKSILKKDPNNLKALIALGNDSFVSQQYQQAISAYSKALSIDPQTPDARKNLGIIYRRQKQFDKAVEAFHLAAVDNPRDFCSRFNLGVVLRYDKGDFQGAIQAWEDFLKLKPIIEPDNEMIKIAKKEIQAMKAGLSKNQTKEEKTWGSSQLKISAGLSNGGNSRPGMEGIEHSRNTF